MRSDQIPNDWMSSIKLIPVTKPTDSHKYPGDSQISLPHHDHSTDTTTNYLIMSTSTTDSTSFSQIYSPVKKLGEGGYGTVWLVMRRSDKFLYAAKIIPDSKCRRKTHCSERDTYIPDEIMLSETLEHPNILAVEGIFFEQESWVIVMEYAPGFIDLFEHISKTGLFSVPDTRNLLAQLIHTVNYLLSKGVDHRDIKDENILYNPTTKKVKLIDFGSASILPTQPYTRFQGTDVYIPPEFYLYGEYSPLPATTWSLGCVAYILLNGDSPFISKNEVKQFKSLKFLNSRLDQHSKEFLHDVFILDEDLRLLPAELLLHPWMIVE